MTRPRWKRCCVQRRETRARVAELLVRDVMLIGVPTCRVDEACGTVAARLRLEGERGEVVVMLDHEGRSVGWATRRAVEAAGPQEPVSTVLQDTIPEVPPEVPAAVAAQLLDDQQVEYAFLMHTWPGEPRPSAFVSRHRLMKEQERA